MAAATLPSCAEVEVADLAQVSEAYSLRILAHLGKDVVNLGHASMIPLLMPLSSYQKALQLARRSLAAHRSSNCFSARQLAANAPSSSATASLAGSPSGWKLADHASSAWFGLRSRTTMVVRQSPKGVSVSRA